MVKNGWVCCPKCGWKLFPVDKETRISKRIYKRNQCRTPMIIVEPQLVKKAKYAIANGESYKRVISNMKKELDKLTKRNMRD